MQKIDIPVQLGSIQLRIMIPGEGGKETAEQVLLAALRLGVALLDGKILNRVESDGGPQHA